MHATWIKRAAYLTCCIACWVFAAGRAAGQDVVPPGGDAPQPAHPPAGEQKPAAQTPPAGQPPHVGQQLPGAPTPKGTVINKPGENPTCDFDTPVYDFGRKRAGEPVRHEFFFTNNGTGTLEILTVRPSCGCTVPGEYDRVVAPGKTGKLPLHIDTTKMNGPTEKSVNVVTNVIGEKSEVILKIKGVVWQAVEVAPNVCAFGRVTQQEPLERKLTIVNNTEEPVVITDIQCDNPCFRGEVKELEKGKKFEMTVFTIPPLRTGSNVGTITFATGLRDTPKGSFSVNAFVPSPIEVVPMRLTLAAVALTTPTKREVSIRNNNPAKPLKVSDVKMSNPALKATLTEQIPGSSFKVTIDIPAGFQATPAGETLSMKTDSPLMPEIVVPITQIGGAPPGSTRTPVTAQPTGTPAVTAGSPPAGAPENKGGN